MAGEEAVKQEEEKKTGKQPYVPLPKEIPSQMGVVVVNMERLLFEGVAKSVIVPIGPNQMLAILPGHTPLFTKIDAGTLTIDRENEKPLEIPIASGLAKITQVKVVILVGYK